MGMVQRFRRWRATRGVVFQDEPANVSIESRIDAVEYELQGIIRDVSRVRMQAADRPQWIAKHLGQ
jgi:hypothetical protein